MATTAGSAKGYRSNYTNLPSSLAGFFHNLTAPPTVPAAKSQAFIAICEDALDQLAVLGDIAPDVGKNVDNKAMRDDIARLLKDQRALESRYQDLLKEQEKLKGLENKTLYKESQIALMDISAEIQQSNQSLAKKLRGHPSVAANLVKIQNERHTLQALINKTTRELRDGGRFESLINAVEEEYKKRNTLQNTINRENEASELLKELQKELTNEKKLLEEELSERNQAIRQLKDTIQEINTLTTSEQKYIRKETKAHEMSARQRNQAKEQSLTEEKERLLKLINQEIVAHENIMKFLSGQRDKLDLQIQEWMTKYEEDTEAKTVELEQLKQRRTQDLDTFEELVAKYEELERTVEEDRAQKAREAEEKRLQQLRETAATKIQKFWRKIRDQKKRDKSAQKKGKSKSASKKKGAGGSAASKKSSK